MEEVIIRDITPTPSFLQPPGQELSPTENTAKAAAVLSKMNIQPEESKKDKNRPAVSSTPVPGTPWCVVWTGDSRSFFFNPSNKQSVWVKPAELVGRSDVAKMLESPTAAEEFKKKQQTKVKSSLILLNYFHPYVIISNCRCLNLSHSRKSRRSRRSPR